VVTNSPSTRNCIACASISTFSNFTSDGVVGRSNRRSTAFTRATSSRVPNGLVM
jgi:hypothetical protein